MIVVFDLETLASCFTYTDINIETEEVKQFVIHTEKNDSKELFIHLTKLKGQIGFNNNNFDYPILHYFILNYKSDFQFYTTEKLIEALYNKAQQIIQEQSKDFSQRSYIKEESYFIKQLDLFKIWHFDNKVKSTSLKALEIAMNYPNVMECSIPFSKEDITLEEVVEILKYNLNDVLATFEFYKKSIEKKELRKSLIEKYKIPCINFSDSKIGEQLILKLYCEKTKLNPWDVKSLRTYRSEIKIKDVIFNNIKFKTKEFNKTLDTFNNYIINKEDIEEKDNTKKKKLGSCIYKGFKYDFGLGGIHGCIKAGVYESNDDYIILDCDVGSMYPSIAVINKLYPEHLGTEFCSIYEDILKQRIEAKKAGNMILSDGFKLSLNSVYGKSKDKYSFLYDPLYTMKTTINGQLMLAMLCEDLVSNIENLTMLQVNTDGLTLKIKRSDLQKYYNICKNWELKTQLSLEFVEYQKMIIRDVNNYESITTKGKIKYKGAFEIDKEYHKDTSFRIIPLALSNYFFKDIPVEKTIKEHKNIYDFCGRQKFKGGDYGQTVELKYDSTGNPYSHIEKQQKNVRYYISNKGKSFVKKYQKGTTEVINKGYEVTIFNNYIELEDYKINYEFYIKECYKEIEQIETKQLSLF